MASPVLPSKVLDTKFISIPPEEDLVGNDGWEDCGKWILTSAEADLAFLDKTWSDLQPLLEDGTLLMLKSSTALLKSETAVFQCFTKAGIDEAMRAARVIRSTIDFKGIMYYKMNKLTQAEIGRRYGHKHISTYMHTYLGRFYIRDSLGDWILEENSHGKVSISSRFRRENYSGNQELPSTSAKRFGNLARSATGGANWNLKCSLSETNDAYLPEADRVCIIAKELLAEGHLTGISWRKNAQAVEVRLYVRGMMSGISSHRIVCDRIMAGASVRRFMYFTRGSEGNIKYTYKYTAEGELYEQTEFAERFVLERE